MSRGKLIRIALLLPCLLFALLSPAQTKMDHLDSRFYHDRFREEIRGTNVFTMAGGSAVMNGDFANPLFDIYFHAGYKRYLGSSININLIYHKFNLAYKDLFNDGHMSFDLNVEVDLLPFDSFTPFLYVGGGLHASNYFNLTEPKVQGGGGFEVLISSGIGMKLFADYNYVFSDEVDGKIFGMSEDVYYRMGLGLNFYFGSREKKDKIASDEPTVIRSNPIEDDY